MHPKRPIIIRFHDRDTASKVYEIAIKTMKDCILTVGALDGKRLEELRKETLYLLWEIESLQSQQWQDRTKGDL